MSRWEALRPESREFVPRKSYTYPVTTRRVDTNATRSKVERRRPASSASLDWHGQLNKLNIALIDGNESNVYTSLQRVEEMLNSSKYKIPPKVAGEALLSLTSISCPSTQPKRLELACRLLSKTKVSFNNDQAKQCVDNLVATPSNDNRRIECVARLVFVASRQLPAEKTANELVGNILLPVLEDDNSSAVAPIVLDAMQCLLCDSLHASALLAPLTLDVTEYGREDILSNPLKHRLMKALQSLLANKQYSYKACTCLIIIIKASIHSGGDDLSQVDLSKLEPFFVSAAREQVPAAQQGKPFELLRLVLKTYPSTSTRLSKLLIGDGRLPTHTSCPPCPHCRHSTISPLLDYLHDCNEDKIEYVAPCIQELLISMPLHLWLGKENKSRGMHHHFATRTFDALVQTIQIVKCRFQQCSLSIAALCPLIQVILTKIPYSENDKLCHEAMDLQSYMSNALRGQRCCKELVKCFEKCMGGRAQPQGGVSPMPVPMRIWLCSAQSLEFREYLWSSLESRTPSRENAVKIVCDLVRSFPSFVQDERATWERFESMILAHVSDLSMRVRIHGMELLEMFLTGRMEKNQIGGENATRIAMVSSSLAWRLLGDPKPRFRIAGLNCYASLLPDDWLVLFSEACVNDDERPSIYEQFNGIMFLCSMPNEANAGVRAVACKCVGSVCTQFLSKSFQSRADLSANGETTKDFCSAACEALSAAMDDSNVNTRNNAVFAIGNLAHALRDLQSNEPLLPLTYVESFCTTVCLWLNEANAKIVNNSIRTIGHLISLTFNAPYLDSGVLGEWDSHSLYNSVLTGLNEKVETSLKLHACRGSTWKERSQTNKHGWGSCNSLALVLECNEAARTESLDLSQCSLGLLVECIDKAGIIHEKVASAATAAVRRISDTKLAEISGESGIIGMALKPCLIQLYQMKKAQRRNQPRLTQELSHLLHHLLKATTISDACFLVKQEDVDKSTIDFLYDWMVDEDVALVSFESFALALQRKDLMDDAALQQKFASRAMLLHRSTNGDENDEL